MYLLCGNSHIVGSLTWKEAVSLLELWTSRSKTDSHLGIRTMILSSVWADTLVQYKQPRTVLVQNITTR